MVNDYYFVRYNYIHTVRFTHNDKEATDSWFSV